MIVSKYGITRAQIQQIEVRARAEAGSGVSKMDGGWRICRDRAPYNRFVPGLDHQFMFHSTGNPAVTESNRTLLCHTVNPPENALTVIALLWIEFVEHFSRNCL